MISTTDLNKVTKIVQRFIDTINENISVEFDSDFYYDNDLETVFYTIVISERADRLFKQFVLDTFNYEVKNVFLLSLLHEVGHYFTYYQFSSEELKKYRQKKKRIQKDKIVSDKNFYEYFALPNEEAATAWAVEYLRDHEKECANWWKKIQKELENFYEKTLDKSEFSCYN